MKKVNFLQMKMSARLGRSTNHSRANEYLHTVSVLRITNVFDLQFFLHTHTHK